jgi:hypothetical protein
MIRSDIPRSLVSWESESNGIKEAGLYQPFVLVDGRQWIWFWSLLARSLWKHELVE